MKTKVQNMKKKREASFSCHLKLAMSGCFFLLHDFLLSMQEKVLFFIIKKLYQSTDFLKNHNYFHGCNKWNRFEP